jgi:hypothetical protein
MKTTRELSELRNTGHAGINALFSKAHSMGWDLDRDVDWKVEVAADDPCIAPEWAPFGSTPTFRSLPREVRFSLTRSALARTLHVLQIGESVAQDVCAKLALLCDEEDYRNHAVAQAMDEARHHMAYVRFLGMMGEESDGLDPFTTAIFDELLSSDDPTFLIAGEQFFLESLAMPLFERMAEQATHPLLRDIVTLINRDESRHVAFGVLYVEQWLKRAKPDDRLEFAKHWLGRIVGILSDTARRGAPRRTEARLRRIGVDDPEGIAARMAEEQGSLDAEEREARRSGRRVPHLLTSARRAGLLADDLLEPLGLRDHPLVRGALRAPAPTA